MEVNLQNMIHIALDLCTLPVDILHLRSLEQVIEITEIIYRRYLNEHKARFKIDLELDAQYE